MTLCWDGNVGQSVHHFGPYWNISTTIWWIKMKSFMNIHEEERMNPIDFGDLI